MERGRRSVWTKTVERGCLPVKWFAEKCARTTGRWRATYSKLSESGVVLASTLALLPNTAMLGFERFSQGDRGTGSSEGAGEPSIALDLYPRRLSQNA
jgi:hypothetical protein